MTKQTNVRTLTTVALLIAMATLLGFVKIPVSQIVEIRFQNIPIALSGILFGPSIGALVGALADILGFIVQPTGAYFPGFTLTSALSGVIFGCIVFKKELSWKRMFMAQVLHTLINSLVLNTLWLTILYQMPFFTTLTVRILPQLIQAGFQFALLAPIAMAVHRIPSSKRILS